MQTKSVKTLISKNLKHSNFGVHHNEVGTYMKWENAYIDL